MSVLLDVLALLLLLTGVVFLTAAVVGLLRFRDSLQRMHASTKAGTLGAMLCVLGAVFTLQDGLSTLIGLLTVLFLLLTVPVAGHVLGRAIYSSGTPFEGGDALQGVLERQLDEDEEAD